MMDAATVALRVGDDALVRVRQVVRWLPLDVEVIDIAAVPELEDEYHLRIPVLLDRRGDVVAEGEISLVGVVRACLSAVV